MQDTDMSARLPDSIFYEDGRYAILLVSPYDGLFDPKQFGITPKMLHTGAYRGFVCYYGVVDGTLLLSSLEIRAKDGVYPLINDTPPIFPERVMNYLNELTSSVPSASSSALDGDLADIIKDFECEAYYSGIEMPMSYTGTLRIGQDPDCDYYRGAFPGFVDWMYRKVLDLKFVEGRLQSATDLSNEMEKIRKEKSTGKEYLASNFALEP